MSLAEELLNDLGEDELLPGDLPEGNSDLHAESDSVLLDLQLQFGQKDPTAAVRYIARIASSDRLQSILSSIEQQYQQQEEAASPLTTSSGALASDSPQYKLIVDCNSILVEIDNEVTPFPHSSLLPIVDARSIHDPDFHLSPLV